jgi:KDO2-lipid IV(A) lauroyltransferase
VCVPFFDRAATSVTGPYRLARLTGAPVFSFGVRRVAGGRFEGSIEPLPLIDTGNAERDAWLNTALHQRSIEEAIRRAPAQWVWHRRRWRMREESLMQFLELSEELRRYVAGAGGPPA